MSTVEYRDIPGFPAYRVGADGTIWSRWKRTYSKGQIGPSYSVGGEWILLKPVARNKYGHRKITLSNGEHVKTVSLHRLILRIFVGPAPTGFEACHADGNPSNNALLNLRWDSRKANHQDMIRHGTTTHGERNNKAKLNAEQVRIIRAQYATRQMTLKSLGEEFDVNLATICQIVRRKTWKHVD